MANISLDDVRKQMKIWQMVMENDNPILSEGEEFSSDLCRQKINKLKALRDNFEFCSEMFSNCDEIYKILQLERILEIISCSNELIRRLENMHNSISLCEKSGGHYFYDYGNMRYCYSCAWRYYPSEKYSIVKSDC